MKRFAPAAARNTEPIIRVLTPHLPPEGRAVEVACGSGQHAVAFASAFPQLQWQPTDVDPNALASCEAYRQEAGLSNLAAPLLLDAAQSAWPISTADVIVSINMMHISPWNATLGLLEGAGRILSSPGTLFLYGPLIVDDIPTATSNLAFDQSLRARNPDWGLRPLKDIETHAQNHGLNLTARIAMPANNFSVVFQKT